MSALKKTAFKYAIICGIMMIVSHLIQDLTDMKPLMSINSFFIVLIMFFGFIFFANKEFKEYKNGGILHFWQGVSIGLIIILTSCVIFSVFSATYYSINESAFTEYLQDTQIQAEKMKEAMLEQMTVEQFEKQKKAYLEATVSDLVIGKFFTMLVIGFLMTPLVAIVLR
ncbi:MAG: DUF4199 domain-containing protein [Bacteroidota bacterium]